MKVRVFRTTYPFHRSGDDACLLTASNAADRDRGVFPDEEAASMTVHIGDAGLPASKKTGRTYMRFGGSEIRVRSVSILTGQEKETSLMFK